jgi:hypothetical protein
MNCRAAFSGENSFDYLVAHDLRPDCFPRRGSLEEHRPETPQPGICILMPFSPPANQVAENSRLAEVLPPEVVTPQKE